MKKIIIPVIAFFSFAYANIAMAWSNKDTLWQSAYFAVHAADWGQTRDIAARCGRGEFYETNPLLGKCPSVQWVNTYFLTTALLHAGIAHGLPQKYRRMFQAGTIGMQMGYVSNNAGIGLNIRF